MFAPDTANKLVNLTLAQNKSIVDAVASGMIKTGTRLNAIFNSATGAGSLYAKAPATWVGNLFSRHIRSRRRDRSQF
jgi:hypothetical protein